MSWPDAVSDCWPDDHTAEAHALYEQLRREAQVPVPEPKDSWLYEGTTAAIRNFGLAHVYLAPPPDVAELGAA